MKIMRRAGYDVFGMTKDEIAHMRKQKIAVLEGRVKTYLKSGKSVENFGNFPLKFIFNNFLMRGYWAKATNVNRNHTHHSLSI